ncbi:NAD(P)/FAD-dependent oxidoreductase [Pseudomonas syringae]|uniref:NAD(P)/FAD-dependent oxidoreductase n=1 Tax=Pseudomonas syringae TaxID=317 RepID=UPI001F26C42D|nr:NAD(P)/FAD-dependent oxidoreductase [Pseudomonas syringae]MBL3828456.1 NAD(P)/FAD-dependent oxidoreductase [Pseudomonas syringae pv. theae]MBL3833824.1 NAD(P)/FAD-dependent oxidoreductase [Pseudomonas syringae pv. theae]MBL3866227.1 NAD(P)/FAD-dependent oxidoreductase [Pseudomonas syringae pv. theae]GKQ47502.1 NAD(P)/FAD-dependent oxidoreductase [Pseudomonas syringae pv. theae]
MNEIFDVLVIGGGFAGCSAALSLSRSAMSVKLIDSNEPRNRYSSGLYSYLGMDRETLFSVRNKILKELEPYEVSIVEDRIVDVEFKIKNFYLTTADGALIRGRYLVLATGTLDVMPNLPRVESLWGRFVFNCLYCGAYEYKGQTIAIYGTGQGAYEDAIKAVTWAKEVVLYQSNSEEFTVEQLCRLKSADVIIEKSIILSLAAGQDGGIEVTSEGARVRCVDVMFLRPKTVPRLDLASRLGCELDTEGYIKLDRFGRTSFANLYVCGDATGQLFQAIGAAADGNKVARQVHHDSLFLT